MEIKKLTALLVLISTGQFLAGIVLLICAGRSQTLGELNPAVWICAVLQAKLETAALKLWERAKAFPMRWCSLHV